MSITVQLDLSEETAAKAQALGLLDPKERARLIARELESGDDDPRDFFQMARLPSDARARAPKAGCPLGCCREITPKRDLEAGEYGVLFKGGFNGLLGATQAELFDFGVDGTGVTKTASS